MQSPLRGVALGALPTEHIQLPTHLHRPLHHLTRGERRRGAAALGTGRCIQLRYEGATGGRALGTLKEGDCFGEMALIDEGPRSSTVRARVASVLVPVDRERFRPDFAAPRSHVAQRTFQAAIERRNVALTNLRLCFPDKSAAEIERKALAAARALADPAFDFSTRPRSFANSNSACRAC